MVRCAEGICPGKVPQQSLETLERQWCFRPDHGGPDPNLAAMFCDRIAVLVAGRVAAYGRPETVLIADLLRADFRVEADIVTTTTVGQAAYLFSGFAAEGS